MAVQPVILLTFSNNKDAYLPMIVEEQKAIKKALLDFADKNYLQLRDVQHASTEEVFYLINRYNQQVAILHYGGHANGQSLQLESEIGVVQTANVKGIAGLLGTQKQLKLVFLNGCASRGQVKSLLDQGVPIVIATRVSIDDQEAQLFASQFYQALASGSSIREAFQKAAALIESNRSDSKIKRREEAMVILASPGEEEEIPWGLYCKAEGESALDWKLPTESPIELNIAADDTQGKRNNVINSYLKLPILKAIVKGKCAQDLIEQLKKEISEGQAKREPTDAEVKDVVIRSFLAPISVNLRFLFHEYYSAKYDELRLRQLWKTYSEAVKLFAFFLLSDLWDTRLKKGKPLQMTEAERLQLKAFFELNEFTAGDFDYFLLTDALLKLARANEMTCYLSELNQYPEGWAPTEILSSANEHFQLMRSVLLADVPSRLIESYCIISEQQLARVLSEWHYLINYKMAVIKNIEVQSIKNMGPVKFKHDLVVLDNYNGEGDKDRSQKLEKPTDMQSVLLYRNSVNDSLNLSPFILDKNALAGVSNSRIYFFSHVSEAGLHYYAIADIKETLLVSNQQYKDVKLQFEKAKRDILNEEQPLATRSEIGEDEDILSLSNI